MLKTIQNYASLVRFSHTIFAMPFALIGFFLAVDSVGGSVNLLLLVEILFCMIFARNAAMAFNRYADRKIDAANPRTANREIPQGVISARSAAVFTILNSLFFIATAGLINPLCLKLSPIALIVILGYTLTKRFSSFCHIFIGLALSIAPIAAYIAVTGTFAILPVLLSVLVLTWVSGFDIIYSLQDIEFDRANGIKSMPSKLGAGGALVVSAILHILTITTVILIDILYGGGMYYKIGGSLFVLLLIYQHVIVSPKNLTRINLAFGTMNGIASVIYAVFFILDIFLR